MALTEIHFQFFLLSWLSESKRLPTLDLALGAAEGCSGVFPIYLYTKSNYHPYIQKVALLSSMSWLTLTERPRTLT